MDHIKSNNFLQKMIAQKRQRALQQYDQFHAKEAAGRMRHWDAAFVEFLRPRHPDDPAFGQSKAPPPLSELSAMFSRAFGVTPDEACRMLGLPPQIVGVEQMTVPPRSRPKKSGNCR